MSALLAISLLLALVLLLYTAWLRIRLWLMQQMLGRPVIVTGGELEGAPGKSGCGFVVLIALLFIVLFLLAMLGELFV